MEAVPPMGATEPDHPRPLSTQAPPGSRTGSTPGLCPTEAEVGPGRGHSPQGADAGSRLPDHRASFQPTVGRQETDDGQQDLCRRHQYRIYEARRKLKHRVPRPMPRNRVWGCDLLTKTDQQGQPHVALAVIDHASRACLRLQGLADKSSLTLVRELAEAVTRYGRPQFVRTDNEAVFISRWFRLGLWLLGIHHQRTEPGCPWQNGRVERFIGTVKRALATEPITDERDFTSSLQDIRGWYNHGRPHDHLQGRTPAEVWAGIDVFAPWARTEWSIHPQESG